MVVLKPKPPTKKKLSEWKKSYDKKKAKPKKLPQGPKQLTENKVTKTTGAKKTTKDTKGKTPNWRDSTYLKQESYLKKLLADFNAKQIRSKADLAVYYGNEERAAQGAVYDKDTVEKVLDKSKGKLTEEKQTKTITPKKKAPTTKSKGIPMRRPNPPKSPKIEEYAVTSKKKPKLVDAGKDKPKLKEHKVTKTVTQPKYKTIVTKGKLLRAATAGSKASEGLYQKELAEARIKDKADITDDYAARGVLRSGLYAQKQGDYEKEYGKQVAETNRQKASKYADLDEENRDFLNDQELQSEQARLEAVRRRAARTGKVA